MDTDHTCDFPVRAGETLTRYLFRRGLCMIRRVILVRASAPYRGIEKGALRALRALRRDWAQLPRLRNKNRGCRE
jgi:hypothetical protein